MSLCLSVCLSVYLSICLCAWLFVDWSYLTPEQHLGANAGFVFISQTASEALDSMYKYMAPDLHAGIQTQVHAVYDAHIHSYTMQYKTVVNSHSRNMHAMNMMLHTCMYTIMHIM